MGVAENFEKFCNDLRIGSSKRSIISTRYNAICTRLNKDFWNMETTQGGRYIGSFGRETANDRVSDIDMLFELPNSLKDRYTNHSGNGQSALLQAVRNSIATTYPSTTLKSDGQIVKITFSDNIDFEVLPAFKNDNGSFTFADSNNGGSWKITNPVPEIEAIQSGDNITNYNLKVLCRMARAWKHLCSVPIKGLLIDSLAYRFLTNWSQRDKSYLYYDWMSRDFFEYLKNQSKDQSIWYAVGSGQAISNPENFNYKATVAYNLSLEAIKLQSEDKEWSSKQKWKEIYGARFPD
jgi:hypothetical protein